MISIIICSRKPDIPADLRQNIDNTIGCEYEVVVIDNSRNKYSIFSAYNEGVRRSKGELLCFCHEDVLYRTQNWGSEVEKLLNDKRIGILGIEGSHFLPDVPMYWSNTPFVSDYVIDNDHGHYESFFKLDYFDQNGLAEVVVCDGVFFCAKKILFELIQFDEKTFSGFHMYDMDICMQARNIKKGIFVTKNILLEHAWSEGDMKTKSGMNLLQPNLELFVQKWKSQLPMWVGLNGIPEYSKDRINNLCRQSWDAVIARRSKAYRLGRLLLKPFNIIRAK